MRETLSLFLLFSLCFSSVAQQTSLLPFSEVSVFNAYRINSSEYEFSPTYYLDGIVYVAAQKGDDKERERKNIPFFELYYAPLAADGMPSNHRPLSDPLNSLHHEGQASFSNDGTLIYYTGNSQIKNDQGKYTMKIYEARKEGDEWKHIVDLPINSEAFSNRHPAISTDGSTLYFASNMPGGYGGSDIYMVKKEGTYWGVPKNLGAQVNTPENDAFPFIYQDKYLFFSSKGHAGNGEYDIYAINIEDDLLGSLVHLTEDFNSPNADFGFILHPSGTKGFFSSNRADGFGKDDIYLFEVPQGFFSLLADSTKAIKEAPAFTLNPSNEVPQDKKILTKVADKQEVANQTKNSPIVESVQMAEVKQDILPEPSTPPTAIDQTNSTTYTNPVVDKPSEFSPNREAEVFAAKSIQCATLKGVLASSKGKSLARTEVVIRSSCGGLPYTLVTDQSGAFETCLPINCQYIIACEKEGFLKNDLMIDVKTTTVHTEKLVVNPIDNTPQFPTAQLTDQLSIGSIIDIQSLAYDLEKGSILSNDNFALNQLVTLMQQHPSLSIEVAEHTDARGSAHYNYELSQARAQIFKSHLVQQGNIAPHRIKAIGMGEQQLRNHCNGAVPCSDAAHQENRRTEVKVTKLAAPIMVASW